MGRAVCGRGAHGAQRPVEPIVQRIAPNASSSKLRRVHLGVDVRFAGEQAGVPMHGASFADLRRTVAAQHHDVQDGLLADLAMIGNRILVSVDAGQRTVD